MLSRGFSRRLLITNDVPLLVRVPASPHGAHCASLLSSVVSAALSALLPRPLQGGGGRRPRQSPAAPAHYRRTPIRAARHNRHIHPTLLFHGRQTPGMP